MTYTPRTVLVHPIIQKKPMRKWMTPGTQERDTYIVRRRKAGDTYPEIGREVGLSATRCQQIYDLAMQEITA